MREDFNTDLSPLHTKTGYSRLRSHPDTDPAVDTISNSDLHTQINIPWLLYIKLLFLAWDSFLMSGSNVL